MFQIDPSWFRIDPWLIVLVVISLVAFVAVAIIWGIRAHRHQVAAGREELIGKTAIVKVALDPEGMVLFKGERWTAVSDSGRIKPGEEVEITKYADLKLYVTKKQK